MTLFDFGGAYEFRPGGAFREADSDSLAVDDLLSRAGDDLGLDVDDAGFLVLVEGSDFE